MNATTADTQRPVEGTILSLVPADEWKRRREESQ